MSSVTTSSVTSTPPPKVDFDAVISRRIRSFSRRRQRLLLVRGALAALIAFVVAMLGIATCDYVWFLAEPVRWSLSLAGYGVTVLAAWWFGLRHFADGDSRTLARQMESVDPRLRDDLLSAVELAEPNATNGSPVFLERLKRGVAKQVTTLDLHRLLPFGLLNRWLLAGLGCVLLVVVLSLLPSLKFPQRMARAMLPGVPIQRISRTMIEIIAPTPATRDVAQGDAVGVLVRTSGAAVDDVLLQWYTDEGESGEAVMTRREGETFAANLPMGVVPVDYRVRGGDGITLWERLTPQPRPRVESFEVRYRFPEYARMEDQVETVDHGDLRAVIGTVADITVTFDQDVSDAVMRFDGGRYEMKLEPVEDEAGDEQRRHHVEFTIRTPATYNIDSISRASGLSNPFSPRYTVTPITDTPPVARWADGTLVSQLVAPLEKVDLRASAQDDLPLDDVKQMFQLNEGKWQTRRIEVDTPATEIDLDWKWDLAEMVKLLPKNEAGETVSLVPGDIVRTRIVVEDRKLQSGESNVIEILVADEGFAKDRHDPLRRFALFVSELSDWLDTALTVAEPAKVNEKQPSQRVYELLAHRVATVHEPLPELRKRLDRFLAQTPTSNDAAMVNELGEALIELDRRLTVFASIAQSFVQQAAEGKDKAADAGGADAGGAADAGNADAGGGAAEPEVVMWRELVRDSKDFEALVQQTKLYATSIVGHEMTLAVTSDSLSMLASMQRLIDPEDTIADDVWPRHLSVLVERIREVKRLITQLQPAMPESTFHQLSGWSDWIETWESRLELAADDFPGETNARSQVRPFYEDLQMRITYATFDGKVPNNLRETSTRFARVTIQSNARLVEQLSELGQMGDRVAQQSQSQSDSKRATQLRRELRECRTWFASQATALTGRLEQRESLERERVLADLRFAADLALARRALANVTGEGYVAYKETAPDQVYREISRALGCLEYLHELVQSERNLAALEADQSRVRDDASSRFAQPLWFELSRLAIELAENVAQRAAMSGELIYPVAQVRAGAAAQRAAQQFNERRYSRDPLVAVILPLQSMNEQLKAAIVALEPAASQARETLSKYVLSLPEQARQAAERTEAAEQAINDRPDSTPTSEENLREPHAAAEQATRETIRALVDLANTVDMRDADDRELARDADVAAAQLNESSREANDAMEMAKAAMSDAERETAMTQAAQSLAKLKDQLVATAEHFENALAGNDVSESRERLRALEDDLGLQALLDERYQDAAEMAERTQLDAETMLRELEEELKQNEPMQQSLDEIAEQAAETAQRLLSRATKEETALRTSLERSDSAFDEQKQRLRYELRGLARQVGAVNRSLLQSAERALRANKSSESIEELNATRQRLTDASSEAERVPYDAPLTDVQASTTRLAKAVQEARQWTEKLSERTSQQVDDEVFDNDRQLKDSRSSMSSIDHSTRDMRISHVKNEVKYWDPVKNEVGRRIQEAQRQQRDANDRQQQHVARLKKDPANESLRKEIVREQDLAERARRSEEQGKATIAWIEEQKNQLSAKQDAILKTPRADFANVANPPAELAAKLSERAVEEFSEIAQKLKQLAGQADIEDALRARPDVASDLANRQASLNEEVALAAELLARAARHQQRLGNESQANELDRASSQVGQISQGSLEQAAQSLAEAGSDADSSAQANADMERASAELAEQATKLAELIAAQAAKAEPPSEQDDSGAAQQLAQTLDELDQAVNGQPMGSQPQSGDKQQASQQGEQKAGQSAGKKQGQKAGEASKTLADAAQSQSQQAAKQRDAQTNPEPAGEGEGEPSDESGQPGMPGNQSGNGAMARGGELTNDEVRRTGSDWGALRERRTDDAVEDLSEPIAPGYRREIEAYFRAIAERGAKP